MKNNLKFITNLYRLQAASLWTEIQNLKNDMNDTILQIL